MGATTTSWPPPPAIVGGAPLGSPIAARKKNKGRHPKTPPRDGSRSRDWPERSRAGVGTSLANGLGERLLLLPNG
ncbi:hypothetical protein Scep_002424 [Stephania cephalantha]|uniref:Uncharacterized protein n=1 Tax=Stephania cephalantha TaxID=152367 RepID=A0AAP0L9Z8_9MAGN